VADKHNADNIGDNDYDVVEDKECRRLRKDSFVTMKSLSDHIQG
jgi:hypothetical protein